LESDFQEIIFQTFSCLFAISKVGQRKILSSQRKIWLGFQKSVFLLFWAENTFPESCEKFRNVIFYFGRKTLFQKVVKNLEMSYYLLIISNLDLKLLIAIYILF
jgi:hypothetical protein